MLALHGDKTQEQRERTLRAFRDASYGVLVATDVASRGLDVTDIEMVLNYDMPFQIEDYVHRIGRTGRAGKYGRSVSLFTKKNFMLAPQLIEIIGDEKITPELISLAEFAAKASGQVRRRWRPLSQVVNNVVNVKELIRKREVKAIEKQDLTPVTEAAIPQFKDYFEEAQTDLKAVVVPIKSSLLKPETSASQPTKSHKWGKKQ